MFAQGQLETGVRDFTVAGMVVLETPMSFEVLLNILTMAMDSNAARRILGRHIAEKSTLP